MAEHFAHAVTSYWAVLRFGERGVGLCERDGGELNIRARIHEVISGFAAAEGISLGKLAQPIRLAVCGGTVSPPIDATLAILGKLESLSRLSRARAVWGA